MLKIDMEYKKDILFCRLKGKLKQRQSLKLNYYLNSVLKKRKIKYLVYNLEKLKDIDLKGIDALLISKVEINKNCGKIFTCKGNDNILAKIKQLKIPNLTCERKAYGEI